MNKSIDTTRLPLSTIETLRKYVDWMDNLTLPDRMVYMKICKDWGVGSLFYETPWVYRVNLTTLTPQTLDVQPLYIPSDPDHTTLERLKVVKEYEGLGPYGLYPEGFESQNALNPYILKKFTVGLRGLLDNIDRGIPFDAVKHQRDFTLALHVYDVREHFEDALSKTEPISNEIEEIFNSLKRLGV